MLEMGISAFGTGPDVFFKRYVFQGLPAGPHQQVLGPLGPQVLNLGSVDGFRGFMDVIKIKCDIITSVVIRPIWIVKWSVYTIL